MNVDSTTLAILTLLLAVAIGALVALGTRATEPSRSESEPSTSWIGRTREALLIAGWFGLMTAVLHLLLAFINRFIRHQFLMVGPQIVWMAPFAYIVIFEVFAIALVAMSLLLRRWPSLRATIGGFAWLGIFALLLPYRQLHLVAAATIAAGVAVQIARIMDRRPRYWTATMRNSFAVIAIGIALLGVGTPSWSKAREWWAMRQLAAPRPGAPNVLLLVLDTVRAQSLSHYGYSKATTPELARWATEGTTFDRAFSTAPWTLKSHATMFTGLYPHQIPGNFARPMEAPVPTLAEVFRARGYATGGFIANVVYASSESGLAKGFVHYDDYHIGARQFVLHSWIAHTPLLFNLARSRSAADLTKALSRPTLRFDANDFNNRTYARRSAAEINSAFLDWQAAHTDRPFFAFLNYFDAHSIYRAPPPFAQRFANAKNAALGRYDGAIAFIDQEIGRLLHELGQRGVLDNTIVILTSDHGEQFGEHGLTLHANSLYLPLLEVPLVLRYPPRVPAHTRIAGATTLRDLAATIVDLAGLGDVTVPGRSLAERWRDSGTESAGSDVRAELDDVIRPGPETPAFYGSMVSLFSNQWHYIRRGDGREELYDYVHDADEANNLAETAEGQRELVAMRTRLAE